MTENFEIVEATSSNHRLTVTPTRVTLKIVPGITEQDRQHIYDFAKYITQEMGEVQNSWRGRIKVHMVKDKRILFAEMITDKAKDKRCFKKVI